MKLLSILYLIVFGATLSAQSLSIRTVCNLPAINNESSGIEYDGPNSFWSHNDSGGQPDLYNFDTTGTLLKTLNLSNATNVDWEDIAKDSAGNFYIGDFGNNSNNRSVTNGNGLKIYIIPPPSTIMGTSVTASVINFEYIDRNFSAPSGNHNFDMEGFFYFRDSLHLFTKNRTNPSNGWIKHYILPASPGTHMATVVDSFNNAGVRITGADLSPDNRTVVLTANNWVYLFTCYNGSRFLEGHASSYSIPNTQKEAIVFYTDSILYITDEYNSPTVGQKLYTIDVSNLIHIPPFPQVTLNGTLLSSNYSNSNQWYLNGTLLPSETNDSLLAALSGYYSVLVTDSFGCKALSDSVPVIISSIQEQEDLTLKVKVITNENNFVLKNEEAQAINYSLYSEEGKLIDEGELQVLERKETTRLTNGVYFFYFQTANGKEYSMKIRHGL